MIGLRLLAPFVAASFVAAHAVAASLVLTEADAGAPHAVAVGQSIELRLPENPSTGYRWTVAVAPAGAAAIDGDRYVAGGSMPGAPGTRAFVVTMKAPADARLDAKLWRVWEGEGSAVREVTFALTIR